MERAESVSIRPFVPDDREAILAGRDAETELWLGPGSPEPAPSAMIVAGPDLVGWVDADPSPSWLRDGEVNLGYVVFAPYRRRHRRGARGSRRFLALPHVDCLRRRLRAA